MQRAAWIGIFQSLPAEQHDKLVLVTCNGTEINLQNVLRAEADYMLLRGRLAACTEAGRVFFLPYEQLSYIAFREGMNEAQIQALFGATPGVGPAVKPVIEAADTVEAGPEPQTKAESKSPWGSSSPAQRELAGSAALPPQSAKAALLERLRRSRPSADGPRIPPKQP